MAVACFFVFGSYRVQNGYNVWGAIGKIGCAGDRRLVNVHGIRVFKHREAGRQKYEDGMSKYQHMDEEPLVYEADR